MSDDVAEIAASLTEAQRKACLAMTDRGQFPGRDTFTEPGSWSLHSISPEVCRRTYVNTQTERSSKWRAAYFLTPLGLALRAYLKEQADG